MRAGVRNTSLVQKSIPVPAASMGLIKGKKGSTISRLQRTPGVASVQLNDLAMSVTVTGVSQARIDSVLREIRNLCAFAINKDKSYVPDFIILCYQSEHFSSPLIRLQPLTLSDESSSLVFPSYNPMIGEKVACTWFPAMETSTGSLRGLPRSRDLGPSLKKTRSSSAPVDVIGPQDYRSVLLNCFSSVGAQTPEGTVVKVEVKLGKYLFLCQRSHLGRIDNPLPLNVVDKMLNSSCKTLTPKFCESHTNEDITTLVDHLLDSGYSKSPVVRHKASVHVIDFNMLTKHFVSMNLPPAHVHSLIDSEHHFGACHRALRCETSEVVAGDDQDRWRNLRFPRRRGFVVGLHPGKRADVRLSLLTRETESTQSEELQEWLMEAWSSRTGDGFLSFEPDNRFHIASARYKEVHRLTRDDFVVSVAKIAARGVNDVDFKWEFSLKSRWMKENVPDKRELQVANMNTAMERVQSLLDEANRISQAMGELHLLTRQQ